MSDEIEVTPEMIEAGANVSLAMIGDRDCLPGHFSHEELAEQVYRAMRDADDLESRLSALEKAFDEEVGQRIRGEHRVEHRLTRFEQICLMPMLSKRVSGPIPWLWRWLGLQWKPPHASR